jgi:hypothetical protein
MCGPLSTYAKILHAKEMTMSDHDRDEIIALENRFWQSMIDKNVDEATALLAPACVVTGAQGVAAIDRKTFSKMMREGQWDLREFSLEDTQVVFPDENVAIIGYKVSEHLHVDGRPLDLQAADTSTWIKQDGAWLCASHTEAILGDPFGRDRTAA